MYCQHPKFFAGVQAILSRADPEDKAVDGCMTMIPNTFCAVT